MIGDSGGRSRGNRQGEGASRKNTPRERSYIDPVRDEWEPVRLTRRAEKMANAFAMLCMVLFGCFTAILLANWFGII